ncbi:hypothetical protein SVA_3288 [Sulfurifustis variabilis]|uniref:DUF1173 domain-containing protein n=1 Tax=Sulfurifustis variabilis TaxID=1675686 RepID=A0A1C7AF31_9GAMM|nr:DUF1173 family protein [Sulfurifustis variabilis]BAU49836.1 hypothetical protein SVA_3288 [Sulfurifustis variabilis]
MPTPLIELPDRRRIALSEIERSREHRAHYLGPSHGKAGDVLCLCRSEGIPMGVGHRSVPHDTYYLYPLQRSDPARHALGCPHRMVEQQAEASGDAAGPPVVEIRGDRINLNLAAPLYRASSAAGAGDTDDEPKSGRLRAPAPRGRLRSLLEVLWSQAELNIWRPAFARKRHYGVVSHRLREVAATLQLRAHDLAPLLYVPPPYHPDREEELRAGRDRWLSNLTQNPKNGRQWYGYLVGIVKHVERQDGSFILKCAHFPLPLHVAAKAWEQYADVWLDMAPQDAFTPEHPIAFIARVERTDAAREIRLDVRDFAALPLSDGSSWIPVDSGHERQLVRSLLATQRTFRKPLAIEEQGDRLLPDVILEDRADRMHLEVLGMMNHAVYAERWRQKQARYEQLGQALWWWDPQATPQPPPLPPAQGRVT